MGGNLGQDQSEAGGPTAKSPVTETAVGLPSQEPWDQRGEAGVGALDGEGKLRSQGKSLLSSDLGPGLWPKWFLQP